MNPAEQKLLPSAFDVLTPYSEWILDNEVARRNKCVSSSMDDIQDFYNVMLEHMDDILAYLNGFPLAELAGKEKNLLMLSFSFIEASISIEMFEEPEIRYGLTIERFNPSHEQVPG